MTTVRRRLRLWVAAWLVFQVTSLSALVPRACCAVQHPAASDTKPKCHGETDAGAAAAHCPMRAADGTPCPMHRTGQHNHDEKPGDQCSIRGACDGPMSALFAFLSNCGVLADSLSTSPAFHASAVTLHTRESLISRLVSPDPPPPRS